MPLTTCPDCGAEVSDLAPACPKCGRPAAGAPTVAAGRCPHCGSSDLRHASGLHGAPEIVSAVALTAVALVPGFIYYFAVDRQPWCGSCQRRPNGPVIRWPFVILIVIFAVWIAAWEIALLTGTAR